jgi:hypothetical protein
MPVAKEARQAARSGQAAGVAGLLFAALLLTSLIIFNRLPQPEAGQDLTVWFEQEASSTISVLTLYLIPFAGIAFLWFMAVLRDHAGSREDRFFDTVMLGSGFIFVAVIFAGAAAYGSVLGRVSGGGPVEVTGEMVGYSRMLGFALFNVYAARVAGVFMMVSSSVIVRTGFLPRWIAVLGIAIALVLLLGTAYFQYFVYLFPAWVALVSVAILVELGRRADSA